MHLNKQIGFIFDHDGVLADTEQLHKQAWTKLLSNHNIKLDESKYNHLVKGRSTKDAVANTFKTEPDEFKLKLEIEKSEIYDKLVFKFLKEIDGVIDFIKSAHKFGCKIAIASAGRRKRIDYSINKFGLKKYIDQITTAEEITKNKPDPEVYIKTIEKLNIEPKSCYIFEDSITGLTAANGTGANVIFANTSNIKIDKNIKFNLEIPNFLNLSPAGIIKLNA